MVAAGCLQGDGTGFDEEARAAVDDDNLLEPCKDFLAGALRVATVWVACGLARVHKSKVAMRHVLRM